MKSPKENNATRLVYFTDKRSPHEIRCTLERAHFMCFHAQVNDGLLEFHAAGKHYHFPLSFRLTLLAATPESNAYSLFIQVTWDSAILDYQQFQKSTTSWFDYWTESFKSQPRLEEAPLSAHYQEVVARTMEQEALLSDIPHIQQQILTAVRNGAQFSTTNKEGGTYIGFEKGHFYRQSFGEYEDHQTFPDEASFLENLYRFYDWDVSRSFYPDKAPETVAWRLINLHHRTYRKMAKPDDEED